MARYYRMSPHVYDPPFRCGFRPNEHSFKDYVRHIERCLDEECQHRHVNHLWMKAYFSRKYGHQAYEKHDTLSANVATSKVGAPRPSPVRPTLPAKARPGGPGKGSH